MSDTYRVFPARLAFGVQVGSVTSVDIVELASGHEQRNARLSLPKATYILPGSSRPIDEMRSLLAFFHQQSGPLVPFLFDDPFDNSTASRGVAPTGHDIAIGVGDGTTTTFALRSPAGRPISFPQSDSLIVMVNNVQLSDTEFARTGDNIQLNTPPKADETVSFGCRFRVLVRFVDAEISITRMNAETANHTDLRLREVLA